MKKLSEFALAEWLLRIALSFTLLSAVADRLGIWPADWSVWGNWEAFVEYTALLNPWFPASMIPMVSVVVTGIEIILGVLLLTQVQTVWVARLTAALLAVFALSMSFTLSVKAPLDYSVWVAAAAAFLLSSIYSEKIKFDRVTNGK